MDDKKVKIDICNVSKSYKGKKVNDNIALKIMNNEIYCIAGFNGSGKTTLLKQIVGVEESDVGEIKADHINILKNKEWIKENISYQPQNVSSLFRGLKVKEAIYYTGILRGLSKTECRAEMKRLMSLFKIDGFKNQLIAILSGGEKQIVSIAMTLIGKNSIIVFDEPTNNLDAERKQIFINEISRLKIVEQKTIILITHDLDEFEEVIDRLAILHNGRVLTEGSPDSIYNYGNSRIKLFIKVTPSIPMEVYEEFSGGKPLNKSRNNYFFIIEKEELDFYLKRYKESYIEKFNVEIANISLQDRLLYFIAEVTGENICIN